jgi:hypothetical protein
MRIGTASNPNGEDPLGLFDVLGDRVAYKLRERTVLAESPLLK